MSKPERLEVIRIVEREDGPCIVVSPTSSRAADLTALVQAIEGATWSVDEGQEPIAAAIAVVRELVSMAWSEGESAACAWLTTLHEELRAQAPRTEEEA